MKQTVIIAVLSLFFSFNSHLQMKVAFAQTQESGVEEPVSMNVVNVVQAGDLIDAAIAQYAASIILSKKLCRLVLQVRNGGKQELWHMKRHC